MSESINYNVRSKMPSHPKILKLLNNETLNIQSTNVRSVQDPIQSNPIKPIDPIKTIFFIDLLIGWIGLQNRKSNIIRSVYGSVLKSNTNQSN